MRRCRRGPRRPQQRAVGCAGAVAAQGQEVRSPAVVDQASAHQRHPVAYPHRCAVARCSGSVRPLADRLRPVAALAARRHVEADPGPVAGPGRRAGVDYLGRVGGLHRGPGAPARGGRGEKGDLQKDKPGGIDTEPADHGLGSLPWRADHQGAPGLRTGPETTLDRDHRRATRRLTPVPGGPGRHSGTTPGTWTPAYPALTGFWPTRHTARKPTGPCCASAASRPPSRSKTTRPPTAARRDPRAGAHPPSTRRSTNNATPWSAASTASSATGRWPPDTTNSPCATKPPSPSPRSTNGSNL